MVSKKAITQGGKVGHFLVETFTMLLPNLTFHVKLFLFTIFDELFSRSKILKQKTALQLDRKPLNIPLTAVYKPWASTSS